MLYYTEAVLFQYAIISLLELIYLINSY